MAMSRNREIIHPQLMEGFRMLYDELRAEGLSDQAAHQRLMTDFDWSLREASKRILDHREDEYAETEKERTKAAESGMDVNQIWLYLKQGGVEVELLNKFVKECSGLDYHSAMFWVLQKGLMRNYIDGQKFG